MSFPRSYKNLHQKFIFFLVFKNLFKKLYLRQYGLTHIVLSRILYKCSSNTIFFGTKNLLENCIRNTTVWPLFSCSRILSSFHLWFMLFFLFQKSLRNLNHKQYGLTYIIHLENIDQFLSKAHIGNSDQDKIWFEPYCPFKDSTQLSIESSFLLLEIFLKNFNQGQYGLIHIVHWVNFDQSLSTFHTVRSMLNFAVLLANSNQENQANQANQLEIKLSWSALHFPMFPTNFDQRTIWFDQCLF